MLKLPEAQYREISNYALKPADSMPEKYFKFEEKTLEELDKVRWLENLLIKMFFNQLTTIIENGIFWWEFFIKTDRITILITIIGVKNILKHLKKKPF